ncbi:MAG: flagellar biosynthesis/type III secretory pathway protein FliH [Bradymonadia bacterium]|jgi:flagellar biosynthesis/type III secretory pathway protein FliH
MKTPVIPPDRAFAVDGIVDHRVRAVLAEARRIRDSWTDAVHAAQSEARASAADGLSNQLAALSDFRDGLADDARERTRARAIELATRLLGTHFAALPEAVEAQLHAVLAARPDWIEVRVPPGVPLAGLDTDSATVKVCVDPALRPGELILEGPGGTIDARFSARLARLDTQ